MRHQSADGRSLSVDFTLTGGAFTVASVYALCAAAGRVAFSLPFLGHGEGLHVHQALPIASGAGAGAWISG